jgi:hypothetical protein
MKANELRLGNWISNPIQDINLLVDITTLSKIFYDDNNKNINPKDKFQPIPLTEEWLVKFGFIEAKRHVHYFEEVFYSKSIIKDSPNHYEQLVISLPLGHIEVGEFNIEQSYLMNIEMNHVHQLQNLFYCLCGEELEIKC